MSIADDYTYMIAAELTGGEHRPKTQETAYTNYSGFTANSTDFGTIQVCYEAALLFLNGPVMLLFSLFNQLIFVKNGSFQSFFGQC